MNTMVELAQEITECRLRLQGIAMWNTYGKSVDELTKVETDRQETLTRLAIAEAKIERARKDAVAAAMSP